MATFASVAGIDLPKEDREGQPIIFDSYDISPVLFGTGKDPRTDWFYFTEEELIPGAGRVGNYKVVFNLRGDDGQATGGLAVDSNLGWKGADKHVATVPQVFDLWADPQERYDIFMNNYTERTWTLVTINQAIQNLSSSISSATGPICARRRSGRTTSRTMPTACPWASASARSSPKARPSSTCSSSPSTRWGGGGRGSPTGRSSPDSICSSPTDSAITYDDKVSFGNGWNVPISFLPGYFSWPAATSHFVEPHLR
jgi:hypothetical protein